MDDNRLRRGTPYPVRPLGAFYTYFENKPVRLVKVDVEGCDLSVLRGARRVIEHHLPVIVCEARRNN